MWLLCSGLYSSYSQVNTDCLDALLRVSRDQEKVDVLYELGIHYVNANPQKAEELSIQMIDEARDINYLISISRGYFVLGASFNVRAKVDTAIALFEESLAITRNVDNQTQIGRSGIALASGYIRKYRHKQAI